MQKFKIIGLLFLAILLGFVHVGNVSAQTFGTNIPCFNAGLPVPTPAVTGQVTAPICINGKLQVNAIGGSTPVPCVTDGAGICYVHPTAIPTLNVHSVDPTPIPVPTCNLGIPCVQITGAPTFPPLPTPIPNSTSVPYFVSCIVVSSGVCPTPLAIQPVSPATTVTPATQITAAASITSIVLFAGNASLNGFTICNSSTSDAYFNFGTTATLGLPFWQHFPAVTVSPTVVEPCFTLYGVGIYRGPISAISTSATGFYVLTWW